MRTLASLAAALLAATAAASAASAQTHRQTIVAQLDAVLNQKTGEGYVLDRRAVGGEAIIGLLPRQGSVLLEITLRAGVEYFIAAGCDTDCDDLDLRVLAPDMDTVLDEDVGGDDVPIVSFTARESGPHLLAVLMPSCKTDLCYFGFRVMSK
jgi:hypothetical protein